MIFKIDFEKGLKFDPKAFDEPFNKARNNILKQFGAYVRSIAQRSIKTMPSGEHSQPGAVPYGHEGRVRYKDWIVFDVGREDVVVGAKILPRGDSERVPEMLEYGGSAVIVVNGFNGTKKTTTARYEPRPHMRKAFDIATKQMLPKLIAGSIVKG